MSRQKAHLCEHEPRCDDLFQHLRRLDTPGAAPLREEAPPPYDSRYANELDMPEHERNRGTSAPLEEAGPARCQRCGLADGFHAPRCLEANPDYIALKAEVSRLSRERDELQQAVNRAEYWLRDSTAPAGLRALRSDELPRNSYAAWSILREARRV